MYVSCSSSSCKLRIESEKVVVRTTVLRSMTLSRLSSHTDLVHDALDSIADFGNTHNAHRRQHKTRHTSKLCNREEICECRR